MRMQADMMDVKLTAREKLKKRSDIDRVFAEGRRFSSGTVRVCAAPNCLGYSRLGVGVSTRVCNAVGRNRLKRITREAFRLNKGAIPPGLDIFITHTKPNATFAEVQASLLEAAEELRSRGPVRSGDGAE